MVEEIFERTAAIVVKIFLEILYWPVEQFIYLLNRLKEYRYTKTYIAIRIMLFISAGAIFGAIAGLTCAEWITDTYDPIYHIRYSFLFGGVGWGTILGLLLGIVDYFFDILKFGNKAGIKQRDINKKRKNNRK